MTIYARSDLVWVAPSLAHGGCGVGHARPVEKGAPVKLWALECPQCETHLRNDPLWSVTVSGIPETPDEQAEREEREKRGQQELEGRTAKALEQIGVAMPQLAEQAGLNSQVTAALVAALIKNGTVTVPSAMCRCGSPVTADARFCPSCGTPRDTTPTSAPVQEPEPEVIPDDFSNMKIRELQNWARDHGVKTAVSKADQLALIREYFTLPG